MPAGLDRLRPGRITDAAGKGLFAGSGASCGGGDSAVVPSVPLGFALRDLTDRAGLGSRAGSILPLVPAGCNLFGFLCIAALSLASANLFAFFCAGCSLGHAPFAKIMPESVAVSRTADRAGLRSCAGRGGPLVAAGCNLFGFLCIAALTLASASLFAFFCAGCSLGHAPFAKIMPESVAISRAADRAGFRSCAGSILPLVTVGRDRLRLGRITDAAGEGPHAGDCAGCSGGDSAVVPGVILGFGDRCSGCDLLSTALAIGIAGIALLSAGGRLGITNLGLGVHTRRCTAPNAVYIVDRSPGCRTNRLLIAAVPIAQLGRGDGDVIIC